MKPSDKTEEVLLAFQKLQTYWRMGLKNVDGMRLHEEDADLIRTILGLKRGQTSGHGFDLRKDPEPWIGEPIWNAGGGVGVAAVVLLGMKPRPPKVDTDSDYQAGKHELTCA